MKGINHLVLTGHDLAALRMRWLDLGFTVSGPGQHPFGTGNAIIQLQGNYIELLSVTIPDAVTEHSPGTFSFSAFNRDYLSRHEGFSMLVLDTADAAADIRDWADSGLPSYAPFEFSRAAVMADGSPTRVGFSLAFTSNMAAPWLGLFACQHFNPDYYAQPAYQTHPNDAVSVDDVWISGGGAADLAGYFEKLTGGRSDKISDGHGVLHTPTGRIVLAEPDIFRVHFGNDPPHLDDGPHLAALTIACRSLSYLTDKGLKTVGERLVLGPDQAFDTFVGFSQAR